MNLLIPRSFYFIRHGQTDWNLENRWQGATDNPLNKTGEQQAKGAIPYFENLGITLICSSDLKRAYTTAKIIGGALNIPVITFKSLRELHFGANEGKEKHEIPVEDTKNEAGHPILPIALDGEQIFDVQKRIVTAVNDILSEYSQDKILISAHSGGFSSLYTALNPEINDGRYVRSDNGVPYFFEKEASGSWNIRKLAA